MKDFIRAFHQANRLFGPVFKRSWGWLVGSTVSCELMYQYFTYLNVHYRPPSGVNFPAAIGQIFTSLIEFLALNMLIPQRVMELDRNEPSRSFLEFARVYAVPLMAESLRALAMTILWTLVFILPGAYKYVRYFLVGYVVVSDPDYKNGKVDALEESNRLVKGITLQLFMLIAILGFLEGWQSALRERFSLVEAPLIAIITTVVFFVLNYYANIFLFVLYQTRKITLRASAVNAGVEEGA